MSDIPQIIQEQYQQLLTAGHGISREECMRRFPELIAYILETISLLDLLKSQGIEVKPLSPDISGVYIAEDACPCCGGDIIVKE